MTGRVIIVTGANCGIGYEVARYLCEGGNDVIMACRNEEKANRAIEKIKAKNPNALATFMQLDLASLESVRKFADDFHASEKKLHVLINNAGVTQNFKDIKRQYTEENFEITMGTNHLGHFLLTNLLLEDLKKTGGEENGDARIINVTSSMHDPTQAKRYRNLTPVDFENFFLYNEGTHNGAQAYKNSKVANVMFTYELAKKLEGTNVTANCVCPGFVPGTELMRNSSGAQKAFARYILHGMLRFTKLTRTILQAGQAICNLASDEKFKGVTGKYIKDGAEAKSSEESLDEEKQKKLWEVSGGYVKMEGFEALEVERPKTPEPVKKEEPKAAEGETSKEEGDKEKDENKTDDDKKVDTTEEKKDEEKKEEKEEEKKEEEKKEEKSEEKTETKPDEAGDKTEEKKEEEKKE